MSIDFERMGVDGLLHELGTGPDNVFNHHVTNFTLNAFHFGGYIAGGFGRQIYRLLRGEIDKKYIRAFLSYALHDIDFFFTDKTQLEGFESWAEKYYESKPTITGYAREYNVDHTRVQVIRNYLGTPEQLLSGFDITNAMVAFDGKDIVVAHGCHALENNKQIEVVNWNSPYTLSRFLRYVMQYQLQPTKETLESFCDHLMTCDDVVNKYGDANKLSGKLRNLCAYAGRELSAKQLLFLSMFMGERGEDYNLAWQHLVRRSAEHIRVPVINV